MDSNSLMNRFRITPGLLGVYGFVYLAAGFFMNSLGMYFEIARFNSWWQVGSVYILYMIPVSLLLRDMPFFRQYAYGTVAMGALEFCGYALGTSHAYPGNFLEEYFGIRNFSLAMTLFFAFYFPMGNGLVAWIHKRLFRKKD